MMNNSLSIAGLELSVSSEMNLYYPGSAGSYNMFGTAAGSDLKVDVDISRGVLPDSRSLTLLAEAESAWKIYSDGDCRWILSDAGLAWAACIDPVGDKVKIVCPGSDDGNDPVPSPMIYPLDQLLMIHLLAHGKGLLMHGLGVMDDETGDGTLLVGVSGAGKTTLADLIDGSGQLSVLSDDRIIIRGTAAGPVIYGTPWPGEGGFALNRSALLKNICILQQGDVNEMHPITGAAVVEKLLPVSSIPWYDGELVDECLAFLEYTCNAVESSVFVFRRDNEAAEMVESITGRAGKCLSTV